MPYYTQRAELVFRLAKDSARSLNHAEVCPAHILLGLIRETGGSAAGVLMSRGISAERIEAAISAYGFGEAVVLSPDLPWSEFAQFVSQEAASEAQALGHDYVAPGHVLLAMTKLSDQQWLKLVSEDDLQDIRQKALSLLDHGSEKPTR